jgi:phosphatidylserine/phosphatidylglycerophosphate/cardiolipin synthase-like enzyme
MGKLQHNKIVVVESPTLQLALCGSTNHSWRGFFVQNNNAIVLTGKTVVKHFGAAFEAYWDNDNSVADFGASDAATWQSLGLKNIDAQVAFSPHTKKNALLASVADDITDTKSSLFFSLAFLYQTPGAIQKAIKKVKADKKVFSYGISDHQVTDLAGDKETEGVDLQKPDGTVTTVAPSALAGNVPEPFKSEPTGGGGTRMHHKFVVIDFDKPTARVYMGSYNFSTAADTSNGENLLLITDRRVATSYVVEALRIFDHYHFRLAQMEADQAQEKLQLKLPPRNAGETAWWEEYYSDARKVRDRTLFA